MEFKSYWKGWYKTQSIRRKKKHLYKDNLERAKATKKIATIFILFQNIFKKSQDEKKNVI